jgi:hypothetical protein
MAIAHFNVDRLVRVRETAVARGLFDELATVYEDEGLPCILAWRVDAVDELCEDDGFAATGREGDPEAAVALVNVFEYGLDRVLLVVA